MNDDELFDRAIDEVAHEMTDAAPRRSLVPRVRERIETPSRTRAWLWQAAAAAAALAPLALVAYLLWPAGHTPPDVQVAHTPATTPGPASPQPAPQMVIAPPSQPHVVAQAPRRGAPVGRTQQEARMRIAVDLDTPQLDAIPEPPDLAVKPLEIAELSIVPLEPEKESR